MRMKRLTKEGRKEQLLAVMREVYRKAKSQMDFTGEIIARGAGVSDTIVYRYIGEDIKDLRPSLPGPAQKRDVVVGKLRGKIKELRQQLREKRAVQLEEARAELQVAELMIDRLDEDNRALRGENALLKKRVREGAGVMVIPPQRRDVARSFTVLDGGERPRQASLFPINEDDRNA